MCSENLAPIGPRDVSPQSREYGLRFVVEPTSNMEGLICHVRFSEGPACQVRQMTFNHPSWYDGRDNRVPPRRVPSICETSLLQGCAPSPLSGFDIAERPDGFPAGILLS